jgi:S1-C subfamily serine protease
MYIKFFVIISAFLLNFSSATTVNLQNQPEMPDFIQNNPENISEIDQKQLFDMIRKGVVAIKVTAHVILDKYVNEKLWFGTGFIVDIEKGLIVTNAHVAGEMSVCTYEVKFGNGKSAEARLEYIDPCYDFAILSVNKEDIPAYCAALQFSQTPLTP